jgi:hypothetical protein
MEETFKLMRDFEERNNLSIVVQFYSDGSSLTEEFWDNEKLFECDTIEVLKHFLKNTNYKLAEDDGRCLSPVQVV